MMILAGAGIRIISGVKLRFLFLLLFVCFIPEAKAQDKDSIRSTHISPSAYKFSLRPYVVTKRIRFSLLNYSDDFPGADYSPNERISFGVGLYFNSTGIWLGGNPFLDRDNEYKGETRRLDLQLNQYGKKFGTDLYIQYYRGFYLQNTHSFNTLWEPGTPYQIRPDIISANIGINVYYVFSWEKFSLRAAYLQTEFQKKSSGSFIFGPSLSVFTIEGDSSLLPVEVASQGRNFSYDAGTFITLAGSPGYMYTFILGKFYINLTAMTGIGFQTREYSLNQGELNRSNSFSTRYNARLAFGYNGKRFFSGLSGVLDIYDIPLENERFRYHSGNIRLYAGIRLD